MNLAFNIRKMAGVGKIVLKCVKTDFHGFFSLHPWREHALGMGVNLLPQEQQFCTLN